MKEKFIFRKVNLKDLKNVLRLNFELFKLEYGKYDKTLNMKWTHKEGKNVFRKKILRKDSFVEMVEYQEKIVGYLCGGICEGIRWRKKAVYAELDNMFIREKYRGRNLGTRLVKNFLEWCKKKKVDFVAVTASFKNKKAIEFYNELDFNGYDLVLEKKISKK